MKQKVILISMLFALFACLAACGNKADEYYESGVVEGYLTSGIAAADENDYVLALECFHKVLDGTEPVFMAGAMNNLGIMYENGLGVERDYTMAMEWNEKSSALYNSHAMNNIGYLYENGLGVKQDYNEAMRWYNKADDVMKATQK